jgi:hypothetical protein
MRWVMMLGTMVLIICFGAVAARAVSPSEQVVYGALNHEFAAAAPLASGESAAPAPAAGVRAEVRASNWDPATFRRQIGPTLRTAFLLGFAGIVMGLGAVGLKSLWVVEEAEYSALSQDAREAPSTRGAAASSCLGDNPPQLLDIRQSDGAARA